MLKLPKEVEAAKRTLQRGGSPELSRIGNKLIANTSELVAMWRSLEQRDANNDDFWVWAFLRAAADASNLAPYHYLSAARRRALSTEVETLANKFATLLKANGLDANLIHINGRMFCGFYPYEDLGESNQAAIDAAGNSKLKVSDLVLRIAKRSQAKIADEPQPGKVGKNARAIRFVRLIAKRNWSWYGRRLHAVTATAANAIFGTNYAESDVQKLLTR